MNQQKLLSVFEQNLKEVIFDFEEIIDTWQASYVRFAGADKNKFESIEHFYFSLMKSDKNPNYGYVGQAEWIDRVNWKNWRLGLIITKVDEDSFQKDIQNALEEINEAEQNKKPGYDRIIFPKEIINCWLIKETKELRIPVGATWSYLIENRDYYFYMERHWES